MQKRNRFIAGLLTFLMIFSWVSTLSDTTVQAASTSNVEELGKVVWDKSADEMAQLGVTKVDTAYSDGIGWSFWHYSGGYWCFNGDSGIKSNRVYDNTFQKESLTAGGVGDPRKVFIINDKPIDIGIKAGSDAAKALDAGQELIVNIRSTKQDQGVTIDNLFGESAKIKSVKKQPNGDYVVTILTDPKINYYPDKDLGFNTTYGLNLRNYVPFITNGYGYNMFSMWPGGVNRGWSVCYVDFDNPYSLEGMREGDIHPTMIRPYNKKDVQGNNAGKENDGGLLYKNTPIIDEFGKYTGQTVVKTVKIYDNKVPGKFIELPSEKAEIGSNTFADGGSYGIYVEYPIQIDIYAKPAVKVIASYVEVESVSPEGEVTYREYKPSEEIAVELDEYGNAIIKPLTRVSKEGANTGVGDIAILNDVISSPKDLGEAQKIDWANNSVPVSDSERIQLNAKDIPYYRFGIITNQEEIVRNVLTVVPNSAEYTQLLHRQARDTLFARLFNMNYLYNVKIETSTELDDVTRLPVGGENIVKSDSTGDTATVPNKKSGNIDDSIETFTVANKLSNSDLGLVGYVRYIIYPTINQYNKVHIVIDGEEKDSFVIENESYVIGNDGLLNDVKFNDLTGAIPDIKLNEWVTSEEFTDLRTNPIPPAGSQTGTTIPDIISKVPQTEDIYADWTVELWDKLAPPIVNHVPEWRLSQYTAEYPFWQKAIMKLTLTPDHPQSCQSTLFGVEGYYPYYTLNPNEQRTSMIVDPVNFRKFSWLHSKALTRGNYNIGHDNTTMFVDMNGTLNLIKSTDLAGLHTASWLTNMGTKDALKLYDITTSNLPIGYTGSDTIQKDETLEYHIRNTRSYYHYYTTFEPGCRGHGEDNDTCGNPHCACNCQAIYESLHPEYTSAKYNLENTFDRYIQQNTDSKKLVIQPEVKNESGITSIKYQLNTELKVYPEYGMLFANDKGDESIKWVVGDQARKISPVVYQTLQHKVYVVPNSNGTSYATDSRAITQANSLGEARKQVIYKGAGVNTAFQLYRDSEKKNKALLTVKTYALDFRNDESYKDIKSSWGNDNYKSYLAHQELLNSINGKKTADATEKLLVDSPSFGNIDYTGATKKLQTGPYNLINYNSTRNNIDGGKAVMFEHRLIVRGGAVIGVAIADRSSGKPTTIISMVDLKEKDISLYNALVGMNLYNPEIDRSKTVFSTFEHLTGDSLTEGKYADDLDKARLEVDKLATPDSSRISEGKGWYSEDTTVLVVKEYVSNYEIPSINFGDKLSMSVKGLETPIDKSQFFKTLGKGHTYLRYDLKLGTKLGAYSLPNEIDSYFEYTSFPGDNKVGNLNKDYFEDLSFGQQKVDYLVPNVSVSDTTRLS